MDIHGAVGREYCDVYSKYILIDVLLTVGTRTLDLVHVYIARVSLLESRIPGI
jgi:hypothetical protein